jgi:two-component system LytT family response regulator
MSETTKSVRVLIVDDEPLAREGVRLMLAGEADLEVIGEAASGPEAVAAITSLQPDLVFLDVQMPGMSGFEVLAALPGPGRPPAVVFITAFDEHALRAFEVHAVDYLLKPVDDRRFRAALGRAREALRLSQVSDLSERLRSLIARYEEQRPPERPGRTLQRLAIRSAGRVVFVEVADIEWIEAADYYVQIYVGKHSHLHRQSMNSLEEQLDPERFLRIHRSAIVNVAQVRELRRHGRRELVAVLQGGVELKVGRSHRDKLARLVASSR